jgi:hypothetical protein
MVSKILTPARVEAFSGAAQLWQLSILRFPCFFGFLLRRAAKGLQRCDRGANHHKFSFSPLATSDEGSGQHLPPFHIRSCSSQSALYDLPCGQIVRSCPSQSGLVAARPFAPSIRTTDPHKLPVNDFSSKPGAIPKGKPGTRSIAPFVVNQIVAMLGLPANKQITSSLVSRRCDRGISISMRPILFGHRRRKGLHATSQSLRRQNFRYSPMRPPVSGRDN